MRVGLGIAVAAITLTMVVVSIDGSTSGGKPGVPAGPRRGMSALPSRSFATVCPHAAKAASPRCRWYSPKSPFNRPIPAKAAVDPNSPLMVQRMVQSLGSLYVSVRRWSVPVYYAGPKTRRYTVPFAGSRLRAYGVPIPNDARPSAPFPPAHTDGQMLVFNPHTGCEYDFLNARRRASGAWTAVGVSRLTTNGAGLYPRGDSERGAGFALGAGLIRPEELKAGVMRHALVFVLPAQYVKGGGPVHPATESDGESSLPGALPEGARVQLDPSFDVSTLPHAWERTIARTLQVYGMYLADRGGGGVGLVAQNPQSYRRNPYPWGTATYVYLPSDLVSHMRVIQLPRQFAPNVTILPSRCGAIR
jgi:hypothetical protein